MDQERKDAQSAMKRVPKLNHREEANLRDMLGLEMKGHTSNEFGLNNLTKQKITNDDKSEQNIR